MLDVLNEYREINFAYGFVYRTHIEELINKFDINNGF